jgi:hypothetical protein
MADRARLFDLGLVVRTPGALLALIEAQVSEFSLISRHQSGDFGEVGEEDEHTNAAAVLSGERVHSSYRLPTGANVWVITEADRSATTVLLPDEY